VNSWAGDEVERCQYCEGCNVSFDAWSAESRKHKVCAMRGFVSTWDVVPDQPADAYPEERYDPISHPEAAGPSDLSVVEYHKRYHRGPDAFDDHCSVCVANRMMREAKP